MPKTRAQKITFSILMSLVMVYAMETYNHFLAGLRGMSAFAWQLFVAGPVVRKAVSFVKA